ncbi:MAG TPA: M14 family metallocarboxypeptidase [Candidatus Lachnoclostridium pullistercoris]|uniref:M14 family metallocarboxypeptidase n=1 Tax=Candidatus Lachnoclostridium pullistercoris TaxID=2838632 RepID=A0A9D2T6B7_9FIRM|nr:M14 family metallocarboxypeptidase [Candidatus Lachnoclostridium pullistercoris]
MNRRNFIIKAAAAVLAVSLGVQTAAFAAGPGDGLITIETGQTRYGTATPSELPADSGIVRPAEKYSYNDMEQDIRRLQAEYGSRMTVNVIGTSADGRNLYEIVVGNVNSGKHVMIQAAIHGREYMTPLLVMKQLETALEQYDTGSYGGVPYSSLFQQAAVHFLPMVNPDGVSISQFGLQGINSPQLRQTIEDAYAKDLEEGRTALSLERYLTYWKANGRGVDLNSNFDAGWENLNDLGHPSYAGYKGESAASEPESRALVNLAGKYSWSLILNYHSMGEVIYWDYEGNKVSAESKELADLVSGITGYRQISSSGGGGYKDWVQIRETPIPSITVEVGSVSCPMPLSEWSRVWPQNETVWAAVLSWAATH